MKKLDLEIGYIGDEDDMQEMLDIGLNVQLGYYVVVDYVRIGGKYTPIRTVCGKKELLEILANRVENMK